MPLRVAGPGRPGCLGHHDVQEIGLIMVSSKAAMKIRRCGPLGSIAATRSRENALNLELKALTGNVRY